MRFVVPVLALLAAPLALSACAGGEVFRSEIAQEIELERLVGLEQQKWRTAAEDPAAFAALLAPDFYAVEPGDTRNDPARRMNRVQVLARLPIPVADFAIEDVRVVRPTQNSAILSYRVSGRALPFTAFATSHWARRNGQWVTVFYQTTLERP